MEFRDFELIGLPFRPNGMMWAFWIFRDRYYPLILKNLLFVQIIYEFFFFFFFYRRGPRSQFQDPKRKKSSRKLSIVSGGSIYYGYDSSDEEDQAFLKNDEAFSPTTSHEMVTLGKRFVKKVKKIFEEKQFIDKAYF